MKGYGYEPIKTSGPAPCFSVSGTVVYFTKKATDMGCEVLCSTNAIGEHGFFSWIVDSEGSRITFHSMEG